VQATIPYATGHRPEKDPALHIVEKFYGREAAGAGNFIPFSAFHFPSPPMRSPLPHFLLILSLVLCSLPRLGAVEVPNPYDKWEKEIAAFEEKDRANPPEKGAIVFVGSSRSARL